MATMFVHLNNLMVKNTATHSDKINNGRTVLTLQGYSDMTEEGKPVGERECLHIFCSREQLANISVVITHYLTFGEGEIIDEPAKPNEPVYAAEVPEE